MTHVRSLWVLGLSLVLGAGAVAAADPQPPEPAWKGNLGLSYLATSGNSDTQSLGFDFKMERRPDPWGLEVTVLFNTADDSGVTTAERYFAGVRGKRALSERWQYFAGLSGEQDEFAGFDLRTVVETGAIYQALLGPTHTLSFDGGLTWTNEDRIEPQPDVDFIGALAGLTYEWKLSATASFVQRLVFYPNFDDSEDWRFTSDTGLQAAVSSRVAVKVSYEIRYRNQPIGDSDDTDTASKVSLVVGF